MESPWKETGHVNSVSSETLPSWSGSPVVLWDDRAVPNTLPAFGWPYACPPRRQRRIRPGCGSMHPYCESEWFTLWNHQGTIHKFYWKNWYPHEHSKFYVSSQFWISQMWQIQEILGREGCWNGNELQHHHKDLNTNISTDNLSCSFLRQTHTQTHTGFTPSRQASRKGRSLLSISILAKQRSTTVLRFFCSSWSVNFVWNAWVRWHIVPSMRRELWAGTSATSVDTCMSSPFLTPVPALLGCSAYYTGDVEQTRSSCSQGDDQN